MPAPKRSAREHRPPIERAASSSTQARSPSQAQLGVHRPLAQPEGAGRIGGQRLDPAQGLGRKPGRRHVERLLEVRPLERIGLVEDRQHLELAGSHERLDGDLDAGHVASRPGPGRPRPRRPRPGWRGCGRERARAASASSARMTPRLAESATGFSTAGRSTAPASSPGASTTNPGCGIPAAANARRMAALSRVAATAEGGLWARPSRSLASAAAATPPSSTATHGVERRPARQLDDRGRGPVGPAHVDAKRPVAHRSVQRLAAIGRDHDLGADRGRGGEEVLGPVGRGGQQEEHARHDRYPMWVETVLNVTDAAVEKTVLVRSREADPERFALWVEVTGVQGGEYGYDLSLQPLADAPADAHVQDLGRIAVVIPAGSVELLRGATLDRQGDLATGGLVIRNRTPPSPAVGVPATADLSGDIAQRLMQVLEQQINPAIAAHGGSAELVAVEADTAYLRLGGGCVGCGMVSVTLRQGIEVALREAVPVITRVIDVTDHASGENPYYEAAKK